jgi:3-oxocholest-4-en-26-oate---CoA ligase
MKARLQDNFASHFEQIADLAPNRVAVVAGERAVTWAEFDEVADRLAGHLHSSGIRAGDRVALDGRNSPEYLVALHAILKLMAVPVNVNYRYRVEEVRQILSSSRSRAVIADADLLDVVREAAEPLAGCGLFVAVDPARGFGPEVTAAPRQPRAERGDTEWLLYTGGTTGHPKAVIGSHAERLRTVRSGALARRGVDPPEGLDGLRRILDIDPRGPGGWVLLTAPPLMHGTGLYSTLGALSAGTPVVLLPGNRLTGAGLLDTIRRHGVTEVVIVGDAFALRLLDALDAEATAGRPLGIDCLREIRSVGAIWSPGVKRRLLTHADLTLIDTIASTEGGPYATSTVRRDNIDEGGTFTLAPSARLVDQDGRDVVPGSGVVGMLAAPVQAGTGYEGDPEKTATAFREIGGTRYAIPGDTAVLDAGGRLRLLGRDSSVINTGGEKVYADEVEQALREHPAVRDAIVLGAPDPRWGSVVAAVVSLERHATTGPEELAAFVGERLARYKQPRRIVIVDEVQRLVTGKADLQWAARRLGEHTDATHTDATHTDTTIG